MRIYLVRHGTAEQRGELDDARRALLKKGERQVRMAATLLARLGVHPRVIVCSPLLRARQTAEVLQRNLAGGPPVIIDEHLVPDGDPQAAWAALLAQAYADAAAGADLVVAGHEPLLSALVARVCKAQVVLRKGGVVEVAVQPGPRGPIGRLAGLWRPAHLEAALGG